MHEYPVSLLSLQVTKYYEQAGGRTFSIPKHPGAVKFGNFIWLCRRMQDTLPFVSFCLKTPQHFAKTAQFFGTEVGALALQDGCHCVSDDGHLHCPRRLQLNLLLSIFRILCNVMRFLCFRCRCALKVLWKRDWQDWQIDVKYVSGLFHMYMNQIDFDLEMNERLDIMNLYIIYKHKL